MVNSAMPDIHLLFTRNSDLFILLGRAVFRLACARFSSRDDIFKCYLMRFLATPTVPPTRADAAWLAFMSNFLIS